MLGENHGHGRVLLIDDEPTMLRALYRLLHEEFDVVLTNSADDALAQIAAGENYHAIVCDILMARMDGREFAGWLRESCPAYLERLIFITGSEWQEDVHDFLVSQTAPVISKPYEPSVARQVIRDMVARWLSQGSPWLSPRADHG